MSNGFSLRGEASSTSLFSHDKIAFEDMSPNTKKAHKLEKINRVLDNVKMIRKIPRPPQHQNIKPLKEYFQVPQVKKQEDDGHSLITIEEQLMMHTNSSI
jgi:hypothetical protein